jgi:hypothetical protein
MGFVLGPMYHCFSNITIALDTSNAWFWIVVKRIYDLDVIKQAGICAKGFAKTLA